MVAAGNIQVEDGKSGRNRMCREKEENRMKDNYGRTINYMRICIAATVCRKIYSTLE